MSNGSNGVGEIQDWINLEWRVPFDDNEEALEALVNIKELEFGDVFTDRDTQLDSEENEGISITFVHEDQMNILHLSPGDEDDLQVDLHLTDEAIDEAENIINSILTKVPSIALTRIKAGRPFDVPFHTLDLPIEDTETEVVGLRIRRAQADFMIQEQDSDTNVTLVLVKKDQEEVYENTFSQQVISDAFDEMESIIEEGL